MNVAAVERRGWGWGGAKGIRETVRARGDA